MAILNAGDITIHKAFEIGLRRNPDNTIQVFEDGRRQTFAEIENRSNRLGNGLMTLGLTKGDHIGMLATNCPEFMEYYLAMSKAGFVCVPINAWLSPDRIAYIAQHSEIKALIFEPAFLRTVSELIKEIPAIKHLIMIGGEKESHVIPYEELLQGSSENRIEIDVNTAAPHLLTYTSGTTGMPKGVLKSMYADMIHAIYSFSYFSGVYFRAHNDGDRNTLMCIPPQFHIGGESMAVGTLITGGITKLVLVHTFEPEKILKLIHEEKVTSAWILPTMVYAFRMLPREILDKYDVSSMKYIICGSTTLSSNDRNDLLSFFPGADLGASYACTETAMCSFAHQNVLKQTKPENLGKPCMFCDMMVGDEQANEIPRGETGIIWIRTPGLPINNEYYKNPEQTAKSFQKGWFSPGDVGHMDEDGYIYYVGRSDDIIMSGGEKVAPFAIEEAVLMHEAVNSCVVVGAPDEKWGECVTAMVLRNPGMELSETELIDFCRKQGSLAKFEIPKRVFFVDSFPTGTTGKVLRNSIRKMAKELIE